MALLVAHTTSLEISWHGSYIIIIYDEIHYINNKVHFLDVRMVCLYRKFFDDKH